MIIRTLIKIIPFTFMIYLLLVLMIFLWGFSFIIVDIAVEIIPPLSIALYRFTVASLFFILMDLFLKQRASKNAEKTQKNQKVKFSQRDWILMIGASFSGVSVFFLAQYNAINLIGPTLPALFVCLLSPFIITILSLFLFGEKLSKLKIMGFIIATIGGFLLVTGGDFLNLTPESPNFLGYFFALLTPILWALYSAITKKVIKEKEGSSLRMLKFISYLGTIELFVFVLISGEILVFLANFLNITLLLCSIYLGLGCYIIGYYIWQHSQKELSSSKVASFLYVEPFLTLILSILFQRQETVLLWNIIGGIIVLFAVLIINHEKRVKE